MIAGSYKSEKSIIYTSIDKVLLKCNCIDGSIVNGLGEPSLYSFVITSPPGHKIYNKLKVILFKKINKSVLSHPTFVREDDDHKPVDFIKKTVSYACQLIKIKKDMDTYSYFVPMLGYNYTYKGIFTFIIVLNELEHD